MAPVPQPSLLKRIPYLKGLHHLARPVLQSLGFRMEFRRRGDLKLGLWRKPGATRATGGAPLKRFVVIPGFGDSPLSWVGPLLAAWPAIRREFDELVIFDFPGFSGFLTEERAFHSMDLMRDSVGDALDSLEPHTLLGHSLGGWLTADYAVSCGERKRPRFPEALPEKQRIYEGPSRVILAAPSGVTRDQQELKQWQEKFVADLGRPFTDPGSLFANAPFWFSYVAYTFRKIFQQKEILQFVHSVRDEHFLMGKLDKIAAEIHLIWGEKDELVPSRWAYDWMAELRDLVPVYLNRVGHSPHLEHPYLLGFVVSKIISGRSEEIIRPKGKWVERQLRPLVDPSSGSKARGINHVV